MDRPYLSDVANVRHGERVPSWIIAERRDRTVRKLMCELRQRDIGDPDYRPYGSGRQWRVQHPADNLVADCDRRSPDRTIFESAQVPAFDAAGDLLGNQRANCS